MFRGFGKVKVGDNFRRNIPEAQEFLYPNDDLRISRKEAAWGSGLALGETLVRGVPVRALFAGGKRLKEVANRPDATPSMHRKYLTGKYGSSGWDVYENNRGQEVRNDLFDYNEQDLGNNRVYVQRENKRFAGDVLSDEFLEDIKAHGIEQDMLEEAVELNKQERSVREYFGNSEYDALVHKYNPSVSAEQQVSRELLFGKGDVVSVPDRFLGADVSAPMHGLDASKSRAYDKSEVRRDVQTIENPDGTFDFIRGNTLTEILNPEDLDKSMKGWEDGNIRGDKGRKSYNEIASEYYGQQALKMKGNTGLIGPRKKTGRMIVGYDDVSTGGSQQKAEGYDFVYTDIDGNQRVADYQTTQGDTPHLNMNLFKGSELRPADKQRFLSDLAMAAEVNPDADFDQLLSYLHESGRYGGPSYVARETVPVLDKEGNTISNKRVPLESGFRAGKFTADGEFFKDTNTGTYRNNEVIYGINDDMESTSGAQPQSLLQFNAESMRKRFVDLIKSGEFDININADGSAYARVIPTDKEVVNMLPRHQMDVISQPYSFEGNGYFERERFKSNPQ